MADGKNEEVKKSKINLFAFNKKVVEYIEKEPRSYNFSGKSVDVIEEKGDIAVTVEKESIFITADNGEVNMMAGSNGDGEISMECDLKNLKIQDCNPAVGQTKVVSLDDNATGCLHQPGNLYNKGKGTYTNVATGAPVPGLDAIGLVTMPGTLGVKIKKAYVKKDGMLVEHTKCKGKALAVVGDKITIEHEFKQSQHAIPPQASTLMVMAMGAAPWPMGMPIQSTTTEGKPKDTSVQAPINPAVAPAWTMIQPMDEFYMLSDAIAGDKVDVDSAITKTGASTSVFVEGKNVALQGNNNICYNDSITRQQCLKIDSGE